MGILQNTGLQQTYGLSRQKQPHGQQVSQQPVNVEISYKVILQQLNLSAL